MEVFEEMEILSQCSKSWSTALLKIFKQKFYDGCTVANNLKQNLGTPMEDAHTAEANLADLGY